MFDINVVLLALIFLMHKMFSFFCFGSPSKNDYDEISNSYDDFSCNTLVAWLTLDYSKSNYNGLNFSLIILLIQSFYMIC